MKPEEEKAVEAIESSLERLKEKSKMELKDYTVGLNDGLQCVVDYLAAGGFEVFGIEPWGAGLYVDRPACTVHIARAVPRKTKPEKAD